MEGLQERFARVELELERGRTDPSSLGFWRLVREVKRDPRLSERWAEVIGGIDRRVFEARVRARLPVWVGNAVLLAQTVVLAALVPVALLLAEGFDRPRPGLAGVMLLVSAMGLSVSVHCPAHWAVGRMSGIRFIAYFLGGRLRIPGIKTDYTTYLRAPAHRRAAMHAAGAVASKIAPFAVFLPAYLRHAGSGYDLLPSWALWGILGFGVLQLITDVFLSTRYSDWKKVRRELGLSRLHGAT